MMATRASQHPAARESFEYNHPLLVLRLQEKEGLTEVEARALYVDLLRFLYLCGTYDETLVPSKRVDTAWHHFILFTRDYDTFCRRYFGNFIHHSPQPPSAGSTESAFRRTLELVQEAFGVVSDNWDANCYCKALCGKPCSNNPPEPSPRSRTELQIQL